MLLRSKQRKGIVYFSRKNCYSKLIKTEKNPQVVKPEIYGDGYLPLQGRAS
jgi:hypothetical protein